MDNHKPLHVNHILLAMFVVTSLLVVGLTIASNSNHVAVEPEVSTQDLSKSDQEASGGEYIEFAGSNTEYDFTTTYTPGASGWSLETSGAGESINEGANSTTCTVGGYEAGTHYARIRRKLPEQDDVLPSGKFYMSTTIELPSDFYQRQDSFMRFITTDNFPTQHNGQSVGANDNQEWRVGFLIFGSDQKFRLQSLHKNNPHLTLWTADSQLSTGQHTIALEMVPSKTNGSWKLWIDGSLVGSSTNVPTVPSTVDNDEIVITRAGGCIDGASDQDQASVSVTVREIIFSADLQ